MDRFILHDNRMHAVLYLNCDIFLYAPRQSSSATQKVKKYKDKLKNRFKVARKLKPLEA